MAIFLSAFANTPNRGYPREGQSEEWDEGREKCCEREHMPHDTHVGVSGAECCYQVLAMNLSMKLSHEWTHLAWKEREEINRVTWLRERESTVAHGARHSASERNRHRDSLKCMHSEIYFSPWVTGPLGLMSLWTRGRGTWKERAC